MDDSFGISDIGLSRLNNEDVWVEMPDEKFFILADGMGGHKAGEVAAKEAVIEICKLVKKEYPIAHSSNEWKNLLEQGVINANLHVFDLATTTEDYEGMGTTLCFAKIVESKLIFGHVGDSRIYRLRKGRLTQLTQDHSLKGELLASGELDESSASSYPYKNVLTRAIGTQRFVKPDMQIADVKKGDLYLICSDGLTDPLPDKKISEILKESLTLKEMGSSLILAAKKAHGSDNITLILFRI